MRQFFDFRIEIVELPTLMLELPTLMPELPTLMPELPTLMFLCRMRCRRDAIMNQLQLWLRYCAISLSSNICLGLCIGF
jgi:hypothetical protein